MALQEYSVIFEDRGDYLYAYLSGLDSFAASLDYWNRIADKVEKLGHKKLLVHETLTGNVSEDEVHDLVSDLQGSVLMQVQIAFYDENNEDANINNLGKLVANQRGAHVQIFKSLEAAQRWIELAS